MGVPENTSGKRLAGLTFVAGPHKPSHLPQSTRLEYATPVIVAYVRITPSDYAEALEAD